VKLLCYYVQLCKFNIKTSNDQAKQIGEIFLQTNVALKFMHNLAAEKAIFSQHLWAVIIESHNIGPRFQGRHVFQPTIPQQQQPVPDQANQVQHFNLEISSQPRNFITT
jgi:hypothetical protein